MIYEFALEPALVARWHDRKEYSFFEEKFGIRSRRVISRFPKKWRKLVWEEFRIGRHGQDQNAQQRLDALLSELSEPAVKRSVHFSYEEDWLEQAEAEHDRRPFRAVVALKNPRNHSAVITLESLVKTGHPRWNIPEGQATSRRAEDLAEAVAPSLRICRSLVMVDPYFNPNARRFRDPLTAFLSKLAGGVHELATISVELHTSIKHLHHGGAETDIEREEQSYWYLRRLCERKLPESIPRGLTVTIRVWKEMPGSEQLHNRYLLSDVAGILFGSGLDDEDTHGTDRYGGQTEDILVLERELSIKWQGQYSAGSNAFAPVGEPFQIEGRNRDCFSET